MRTLVVVAAILLCPSLALAAEPRFGARGQWVVDGAVTSVLRASSYEGSDASYSVADVSPGVDFFLERGFSVGLTTDLTVTDGKGYAADGSLVETKTTLVEAAPRVGYALPLGRVVTFYPRLTVGFEWRQRSESIVRGSSLSIPGNPLPYPSSTQTGPFVSVFAPLLVHVTPRFFVGAGPSFFRDFGDAKGGPDVGGEHTTWSARFVLGGALGGDRPETTDAISEPPAPARRFGETGVVALSSEIGLSYYATSYVGTPASSTSFTFAPSADVFVGGGVSLGLAALATDSTSTSIDATSGATVDSTSTSVGLEPRIGFNVPLAAEWSLYPRAGLGFSHGELSERSQGKKNEYADDAAYVEAFVPLLFHPAPHLFAGLGPTAYHDLGHSYGTSGKEILRTTVGASFVIGGWL